MAQSVRAFASKAEGCMFEFQPLQTYVVKTGSDSSNAKPSATVTRVLGDNHYRWMSRDTVGVAR